LSSVGDEELRRRFELPDEFEYDGFSNWVPTHPSCNRRKRDQLFDSPELLLHLMVVRSKAIQAQQISQKMQNDRKKARTFALLATDIEKSIENGTVTKEGLEQFLSSLPGIIKKGVDLAEEHLFIAPDWEIIRGSDGHVRVVSNPQARDAISSTSSDSRRVIEEAEGNSLPDED
jgi:hypothetical protein